MPWHHDHSTMGPRGKCVPETWQSTTAWLQTWTTQKPLEGGREGLDVEEEQDSLQIHTG